MNRFKLANAVATVVAAMTAGTASASVVGSLSNFDVINGTGKPAYGFEIEIEDSSFDHSKITSIFGYDRDFGLPGGPGAVTRYGRPTITDLPTGVLIRYGGILGGPSTPSAPYNTSGESCWPLGAGWSLAASCDHFGVSTLGQPAATKYSWIVETSPGVLGQQIAGIPAVNFAYRPPAGGQPGAVGAVIRAEAPDRDEPENVALWGEAFWVKTFKTEVEHNIDLGDLLRGDEDQEAAEVEVEWKIFQKPPAGEAGENEEQEVEVELGDADKAIIRRYEFYKYLGPVNGDDGEAKCDGDCENDPLGLLGGHADYVGDFVGAQMAGFNVDDLQAPIALIPEPQTYALMLAGLGLVGVAARRRTGGLPTR
ncbi:MAG: PEPxxWA-CTERM sorting domain-containing protein [Burkholderiaceae bacterium]|nr:PEPxxWA-CTERM sorting domain-containing protein [Burkholderiaceae bacterium]